MAYVGDFVCFGNRTYCGKQKGWSITETYIWPNTQKSYDSGYFSVWCIMINKKWHQRTNLWGGKILTVKVTNCLETLLEEPRQMSLRGVLVATTDGKDQNLVVTVIAKGFMHKFLTNQIPWCKIPFNSEAIKNHAIVLEDAFKWVHGWRRREDTGHSHSIHPRKGKKSIMKTQIKDIETDATKTESNKDLKDLCSSGGQSPKHQWGGISITWSRK